MSTTLPIGIDLGRRRVRAALCEAGTHGKARLIAVSARDHSGDAHAALAAALDELQTRERRCVVALGAPDAMLCTVAFPPMPRWERMRAARFEAARFVGFPITDARLSLVAAPNGAWTIGIARREALAAALGAVRKQRMRPLAVDDAALALRRVHPAASLIVDIGAESTRVIWFPSAVPAVAEIPIGGDALTGAIAQSLGIDVLAAEERKRRIGLGGAGEPECDRLIVAIAGIVGAARANGYPCRAIALCGNGARIPGLTAALAVATDATVVLASLPADPAAALPADVLRAAGADWSTAYGLSLWSIA